MIVEIRSLLFCHISFRFSPYAFLAGYTFCFSFVFYLTSIAEGVA